MAGTLNDADVAGKHRDLFGCSAAGTIAPSGQGSVGFMMRGNDLFLEEDKEVGIGLFENVTSTITIDMHLLFRDPAPLFGKPVVQVLAYFCEKADQAIGLFD